MVSRAIGVMWIGIGVFFTSSASGWMILEERLIQAIPSNILPFLGMFASMVSLPVLTPPPYGAQVTFIVGVFLMILGARLTIGIAGTRIVAAFIHMVVGFCLVALTFLLFSLSIPWPSENMHYTVCGAVLVLAIGMFASAVVLYKRLDDPNAYSWKPFEQCPKCGRKIDASKQCPIHDIKIPYPRLVDVKHRRVYPIPLLSKPALIGRNNEEADVWFDEAFAEEYLHISRDHARISYDRDANCFYITPIKGSSGVLVAEHQAEPEQKMLLPTDAVVKLGNVPFLFEVKEWTQAEVDQKVEDVRYALES